MAFLCIQFRRYYNMEKMWSSFTNYTTQLEMPSVRCRLRFCLQQQQQQQKSAKDDDFQIIAFFISFVVVSFTSLSDCLSI